MHAAKKLLSAVRQTVSLMRREKDGAKRTKQLCCSTNTSVCHISIRSGRAVVSPQAIIYRQRLRFIKLLLPELVCSRCTGAVGGRHLVKTDSTRERKRSRKGGARVRSGDGVRAILTNTKMEPGRRTKPPPPSSTTGSGACSETSCERVPSQEALSRLSGR